MRLLVCAYAISVYAIRTISRGLGKSCAKSFRADSEDRSVSTDQKLHMCREQTCFPENETFWLSYRDLVKCIE